MLAGSYRHDSSTRCPSGVACGLWSTLLFAVLSLLLILLAFLLLPVQPASAQETRWVLVETAINPDGHGLEFYGGGSTPLYYSEPRYDGKYQIYTVTETSFSIDDRWVDSGEEWYHITFRSSFDAPPAVLVPGGTYPLRMDFSHTGSVKKGNPFVAFSYSSPSVAIGSETPLPDNVLRYFPWAEVPSTVSSMTWLLRPPPTSQAGLTLEIYAGWSAPCKVKWVYRSEMSAPSTTETSAPVTTQPETTTSTSASGRAEAGPRTFTDEEFEQKKAVAAAYATGDYISDFEKSLLRDGYIGMVEHVVGDYSVYDHSGRDVGASTPRYVDGRRTDVQLIRIGDTLRTGAAYVIVRMFTQYRTDVSILEMGAATEVVFTDVGAIDRRGSDYLAKPQTIVQMLRGAVRHVVRGWRANSIFSVSAGTTLLGMRGTDVLISYDPDHEVAGASTELLYALVLEGHVDVVNLRTGKMQALTDKQSLHALGGEIGPVLPLSQEAWDALLEGHGFGAVDPLNLEAVEIVDRAGDRPTVLIAPEPEGSASFPAAEVARPGLGSGLLALVIVSAVVVVAAIGTAIYLLRRSRRRSRGGAAVHAGTPSATPPFCRHCGSAVGSGSKFCGGCGSRL